MELKAEEISQIIKEQIKDYDKQVELSETGDEAQGVAIGRFIRLSPESDCAEVALTVVDRMQGKGLGRLLLERMIAAATERGIRRFRFECLPHNLEMQRLINKVCQVVELANDAGVTVAEIDLPGDHPGSDHRSDDAVDGLFALLRGFATETLELQMSLGLEAVHRTLDTAFDPRFDWLEFPASKPAKT